MYLCLWDYRAYQHGWSIESIEQKELKAGEVIWGQMWDRGNGEECGLYSIIRE